jgi:hypothetical protein
MENIWFEDELVPLENQNAESTKGAEQEVYKFPDVRAVVRIAHPVWEEIKPVDISAKAKYWLLRMRVEFETINPSAEFLSANCQAYLEKLDQKDKEDPQIVEIFPQNLIDQEPRNIKIKLEPTIKFGFAQLSAEASLGELSKEILIGRISSETLGYLGSQQRNPHWKLSPGKYPIEGIRDFFMVIQQPFGCKKITLRPLVEARIRNSKGIFYIGPKEEQNLLSRRPRIIIE